MSIWLSYSIRLGEIYPINSLNIIPFFIIGIIGSVVLWINNTYNILLRFIDHKQFFNLLFSTFIISSLAVALLGYVLPNLLNINFFLPRSIPFLFFGTLFILLSNFRFVAQQILNLNTIKNINKTHVLIYGADENGYKIYNTISKNEDYNIIGFIDNDRSLQSTFINNKKF